MGDSMWVIFQVNVWVINVSVSFTFDMNCFFSSAIDLHIILQYLYIMFNRSLFYSMFTICIYINYCIVVPLCVCTCGKLEVRNRWYSVWVCVCVCSKSNITIFIFIILFLFLFL